MKTFTFTDEGIQMIKDYLEEHEYSQQHFCQLNMISRNLLYKMLHAKPIKEFSILMLGLAMEKEREYFNQYLTPNNEKTTSRRT